MDKKQRKSIWTSLAMLIFLPLLVFWVFHDDYQEIWNNIRGVPAEGLLLLLGLGAAYQLLESAAGFTLIQSQLPDFRFWQAVEVTFLGVFANVATFSAGIIPLQSWYLYRRGLTAGSGAGTMTLEYTFHKCTILIYATAMLLLQGRWLAGENAGLALWLLLGYGVCALIITGLLLLCAWQRVQRLACLGLDRLPETGKWGPRKAAWKADLAALYAQSRRLLRDRERLVRVLGWNSLKLFCLYLTLFLSLRMVGVSVLSLWRVQLLGGLMHIIVSALPNIAGMGPAEVSFWLIFSRYMEYGQLSSALILYRTATFFVPFALSVVVFLAIQRRAAAGDRQPRPSTLFHDIERKEDNTMAIMENLQVAAIKQAYAYLDRDPDANIPKLMDLADKLDVSNTYAKQRAAVREALADPDNNWYRLVRSLWDDVDDGVRKKLFENFLINANFLWAPRQAEAEKRYNCNIPWAILMDPTSACNLHCTGCWAAEYGNRLNMDLGTLDSIIRQAKELGIRMFIYSGGEPLMRKKDLITLCEKHSDCVFLSFTNGTLIDEEFADEMLRVGNFVPAISVEGFEEGTDFRRGQGTFARVKAAMELLHAKKLPFGVSCCYTSQNYEMIGSEEYFDWMIEMGAKFCWIFTYMPVGSGAPTDLMATAEQREYMYRQVRAFRKTKALFTMDFWNDGEFVGGCIAAGRNYLHINANGDIEPCAFIHYSDSNIKDKTLVQAFQSPLFMAYRAGQPFSDNLLRPCPLLDNPGALAGMVERSGAHSTDLQSPEDVRDLSEKCREKAEKWKPAADRLWACGHDCPGCEVK